MPSMEFGSGPREYIKALRVLYDGNPNGKAFYDFILRNAQEKKKQDFTKEEQTELDHIFSQRFPAKQCYANAQTLAICNDDIDYVEGWVDSGLPIQIEHAWNALILRTDDELTKILPKEFKHNAKTLYKQDEETKRFENAIYYGIKIPKKYMNRVVMDKKIHTSLLGEFYYHCIHPMQKGLAPPRHCGDVHEYL